MAQTRSRPATSALEPDTRRRLIQVAMEEFSSRGYHGTTTRDISKASGLSPAALYVHFPSKEALLYEVMRDVHEDILDRMRRAAAATSSPSERLAALVSAHAVYHAERRDSAKVAEELPALRRRWRNAIVALRSEVEALVDEAIEGGVAAGELWVEDRRSATFFILSAGIGVCRWFSPDGRLSAQEVGSQYADLVAKALAPPAGGRRSGPTTGRRSRSSSRQP